MSLHRNGEDCAEELKTVGGTKARLGNASSRFDEQR